MNIGWCKWYVFNSAQFWQPFIFEVSVQVVWENLYGVLMLHGSIPLFTQSHEKWVNTFKDERWHRLSPPCHSSLFSLQHSCQDGEKRSAQNMWNIPSNSAYTWWIQNNFAAIDPLGNKLLHWDHSIFTWKSSSGPLWVTIKFLWWMNESFKIEASYCNYVTDIVS